MIDHPKSREHKNTYLCGLWVTFILQYSKLNLRMLFGASQSLVSIFKCVASKKVWEPLSYYKILRIGPRRILEWSMPPSANSWMVNATLRLKSLPISGLEEWKWQDDIWVSIQSYNVVTVDASCSLNFERQLQCKCLSARPCNRKRNAFTRGVFIKVDKRTRKKIFICFWKCVDVEYKHIAFITSTAKILVLVTNSGDVPQFLSPSKKIKFCDSRLASCVFDLYLLIKIRYLINY